MPTAPQYFYPRSPCGERREAEMLAQQATTISIHALLAESDEVSQHSPSTVHTFLSTLSLRRATGNPARRPIGRRHFYPRSPCGERPNGGVLSNFFVNFYTRSPCGERPPRPRYYPMGRHISIHALLAESDVSITIITICIALFLSTLSLRRATRGWTLNINGPIFLSTLSLRRATDSSTLMKCQVKFLSTLSLRRATFAAGR